MGIFTLSQLQERTVLRMNITLDIGHSGRILTMLIQIHHTITTTTIVYISQLPGTAVDRSEQTWRFDRLIRLIDIKVRIQLPLAGARSLICRYQEFSSCLFEMMLPTLRLVDHHIFAIHLIIYNIGINDVIARIEVEFWSRNLCQILIDQRVIDTMTVWETNRVINHILLGHRIIDDLRCPGCSHILHISQTKCLHIFLTLEIDANALVPMNEVVAEHQNHDMVTCPTQFGSHISTSQHVLATLRTHHIRITHTARLRKLLGIEDLTTIEEITVTIAIAAQGERGYFLRTMHVGIEITILISILSQDIVLHFLSHLTHFQLEYVEGESRNLQGLDIRQADFFRRNHLERFVHCILVSTVGRGQSNHRAPVSLHILEIQLERGCRLIRIYHLQIEKTLLLIQLCRLINLLFSWYCKLMNHRAIQLAGNSHTIHLNLDIIPAVVLDRTGSSGKCRFRTIHTHFYSMSSIIPSPEIPPAVVIGILIIENNEEAFSTPVFLCTKLVGIFLRRKLLRINISTVGRRSGLLQFSITDTP